MKKYRLFKFAPILLYVIILSVGVSCQEEDDNRAFVPYRVAIGGPNTVAPGEVATFYTDAYGDETFTWEVPAGATILEGVGTDSIKVSFEAGSSGDITIQARGLDGRKSVKVESSAPEATVELNANTVALNQGASDTLLIEFDTDIATDPEVMLVPSDEVSGGTISPLVKVDEDTYQVIYTAGAGNGTQQISVDNAISTPYYGALEMDTVVTFDLYEVDNTSATGRLLASGTPVYDSGSVVTLSAVFSEALSTQDSVQISLNGITEAYVTNAIMDTEDGMTWTYNFESDGEINELVSVSVSNLPADPAGNPTQAVEPIIIQFKND